VCMCVYVCVCVCVKQQQATLFCQNDLRACQGSKNIGTKNIASARGVFCVSFSAWYGGQNILSLSLSAGWQQCIKSHTKIPDRKVYIYACVCNEAYQDIDHIQID